MADVIFTSIKKILTDANLPLTLKFDNDKSKIDSYKAMFGGDFPQGSSEIELVNFDTGAGFESSIVGLKFNDLYENSYTITAYNGSTATITPELVVDMVSGDVVDLRVGDTLVTTFYSSSVVTDRAITNKRRRIVESYDLELAVYEDSNGSKSNNVIKKISKVFSNQSYCEYNESGVKTGKYFFLELSPTFSRRDNTDLSRSYIGRVRFWKYENYNDI